MADKYNANEIEKKWQEYWQQNNTYAFDRNSDKKIFSIDTPPPTVSGKIHMGHMFSYSQSDFVARYKRMTGHNVFYPFGFDDNGLPTERLVEKERGVKAYQVSREEFTVMCNETAKKYRDEFKQLFISAGNSADWNLSYSTVSPELQKTSQLSFIDLLKKGHVYYAEKDALWCTECQTSIAQAELETKDLPSIFNYMVWNIADSDEKIEIATTRPEMLCACVAVFVNPEDEKNKHLIGKKVIVPIYNFQVEILSDELVELNKGSGIVMCCTYGDQTDVLWQKKHNLPYKQAFNDYGKMTNLAGKYENLKIKIARQEIINDLKEIGCIIKQEELVHAVATHERCGTPMEITNKKQWFIDLLSHRQEWIDRGNQITWYPSYMKSRYMNWVENIDRDWCISRQKYFGVPFPVWYCKDCGEIIVASEDQLPLNPLVTSPNHACPKCGGTSFLPETDVLDTWATSSITPLINTKWNIDDELFKKLMPMSLRPNAHDIIRTWDFYTVVKCFYNANTLPWNNAMISGFVMADKNEKISKSKNNSKLDPYGVIESYSADIMRYWASTGSLGKDIVLSEEEFKNGVKLVNKIWNASRFALSFLDDYELENCDILDMDKWMICSYNKMLDTFMDYFNKYEIGLAMNSLETLFWNFCDNYIEICKRRLYNPDIYGLEAKRSAQYTIFKVLQGMLKCFAIYLPHISEEIYQNYFIKFESVNSIHNTEISKINIDEDNDIIANGDSFVEIVKQIRGFKSENKISLKAIIKDIKISTPISQFIIKNSVDLKNVCSIENLNVIDGADKIEYGEFIIEDKQ